MHRRGFITAAVMGLTAGCSGDDTRLLGDSEGSITPSPDWEWTSENGLDIPALEETHVSALSEAGSYTITSTAQSDHEGEETPGLWVEDQSIETRFDADQNRRYLTHDWLDTDEQLQVYTTLDKGFIRRRKAGQISFQIQDHDATQTDFAASLENKARTGIPSLADWNPEFTVTTDSADQPGFTYEGESFGGSRKIPDTITEATISTIINKAGVVRQIATRYAGTHQGQIATIEERISYDSVGSTEISAPDWLDTAREATEET